MLNINYYLSRFQREVLCQLKILYSNVFPYQGEKQTILVVGAQRSGTNLLMDVLERSFQTDVYHERDQRAFENYLMRPLSVIDELRKNSKFPFFVIKGLCESHKTDELLTQLAPARAIWVVRDYNDVVNSMNISFKETQGIFKQIKNDRYAGGWRTEGMSDEVYQKIKPLIHDNISNQSASALQWYIRNIIFFEKEFNENKNIFLLNYNLLVTEPVKTFERVCEFIGIYNKPSLCNIVKPDSIKKNKSPYLDPEVEKLCQTLWYRFENHFLK